MSEEIKEIDSFQCIDIKKSILIVWASHDNLNAIVTIYVEIKCFTAPCRVSK